MHFNNPVLKKKEEDRDSSYGLGMIGNLISIDTIRVDDRSRLVITKYVKEILGINAGDTVAVYKKCENDDIVFTIQRDQMVTGTLIIKRI